MSEEPSTTIDLRGLTGHALVQIYLVARHPQTSKPDRDLIVDPVGAESYARDWPRGWWKDPSGVLTDAQMRECREPAAPEERPSES